MINPTLSHTSDKSARVHGQEGALTLFHEAATRVPAYKKFLATHDINPAKIKTLADFSQIPPTDKLNYITQFSLEELSWDGRLDARYISMSSGSTGQPFFWPRGREQDDIVAGICQPIYEDVFNTKKNKTLFVNSFALGAWIAGLELNTIAVRMGEQGNKVTVITPGIDKTEAIREIIRLAPHFHTIILAGYPPFLRDIVRLGLDQAFDWSQYDVRFMPAGEAISEAWRDYMLGLVGQRDILRGAINIYGMAETGVVATETPASIALRRSIDPDSLMYGGNRPVALYQYDPAVRFFQEGVDGSMLLTSRSGLPLVRYNTRDRGGLLDFSKATSFGGDNLSHLAGMHNVDIRAWERPFMYLFGRRDLSASLYAVNIYPENVKAGLEHNTIHGQVSGMFVMETKFEDNLEQFLEVSVELGPNIVPSDKLLTNIEKAVTKALQSSNSEYRRLHQSIGEKAAPRVVLAGHGQLQTSPGRKHRWVKRG